MDIADSQVPQAAAPRFQHLLDTYASETNKTASVWRAFQAADLPWRPHPRSSTVEEIMRHQLLSERRFFGEFLGSPEPPAPEVLPPECTVETFTLRLVQLAAARLPWMSQLGEKEWLQPVGFFGASRQRNWVFWRRVLHSAHHRTQLTVYLRLLDRTVPSTYGPTADVTWSGADPTLTVEAAGRHP
ncbi:MAG TPA: DinB family protein [Bryobacteraceae bacterium]